MQEKNSLKTPSTKSTWRISGSIRGWFTRTLRGKHTSLNHSTYPTHGVSIVALILAVLILLLFCGLALIATTTGMSLASTTLLGRLSSTMLVSSIAMLLVAVLSLLTAILQEPSGSTSSPKRGSTSPQQTKKQEPTSTAGSDSVSRKFQKSSRSFQDTPWGYSIMHPPLSVALNFSSSTPVPTSSVSLKPTAGKKRVLPKPKT